MSVRPLATTAAVVAASWVALGVSAPAFAVCDAYSGSCPSAPATTAPADLDGNSQNPASGGTTGNPSTLPFTGGELVLMTAVGVGALAGGTALVVAGRRKAQPSS